MTEYEEGSKYSSTFIVLIFVAGLIVGGMVSIYIMSTEMSDLRSRVSNLQSQISNLWGSQNITYQNITIYQNSTALSELYDEVRESVVLIFVESDGETRQGSGFIYNFSGKPVVITNYHVVHNPTRVSVTFSNGNGYEATVNGTDPYADLAVLSVVDAPESEFTPLEVVSSSTLRVGDPVIALGNPYGLVGSLTTGVVSALGRTITEEEYAGGYGIPNIIQTSAPINPGNSGGPLLNYIGKVVGITTAIVEDAQGLGFAVPSNTINREISSLVNDGTYEGHSYLGLMGRDMNYEIAQDEDYNVTFGWKIVGFLDPSPSQESGIKQDDIIIAMNQTRIKNSDDLASYLEEYTSPGETLILEVIRKEDSALKKLEIPVELGQRPAPNI
ncbi:MAG: trypsin-like peptidase domain-containing protein [Candidatus Bathyarchaeota archaeon]